LRIQPARLLPQRQIAALPEVTFCSVSSRALLGVAAVIEGVVAYWTEMFTGLVEGRGTVSALLSMPAGLRLRIEPETACAGVSEAAVGDSVSISGCCLTVVSRSVGGLEFEAGLETLSKTHLGRLREGDRVNLERSLRADARLGGHFVQGHVDGTARVSEVVRDGEWVVMWFRPAAAQLRLLVPKGSVAVDGVSLTVVDVEADRFSVALIPHTLSVTTLGELKAGDEVNLENDILGKYVDHLLRGRISGMADQ
jgi:riboflavin synthase